MSKALLVALFVLVTSYSCNRKTTPPETIPSGSLVVTVIDYRELDGCEFLLQMEDGKKLQPVNLPDQFKVNGMKLYIIYKYHNGSGVCMSGRMVSLISVIEKK